MSFILALDPDQLCFEAGFATPVVHGILTGSSQSIVIVGYGRGLVPIYSPASESRRIGINYTVFFIRKVHSNSPISARRRSPIATLASFSAASDFASPWMSWLVME